MLIRQETATETNAIDAVHAAAFAVDPVTGTPIEGGSEPVEVGLVRALRSDSGWVDALSLVAESKSRVVGHVVCTVGAIAETPALGLGPIGVLPTEQGRGVGTALMHSVLGAADSLGYPVVVLLGRVDYYQRFGFVPARSLGISPTEPSWGESFQARELAAWSASIAGVFEYASPFAALE